jgi:hypothetical protein
MVVNRVKPQTKRGGKQHCLYLHQPDRVPDFFGQCWECYRKFKPAFRCQVYCNHCRSELVIVSKVRTGKRK